MNCLTLFGVRGWNMINKAGVSESSGGSSMWSISSRRNGEKLRRCIDKKLFIWFSRRSSLFNIRAALHSIFRAPLAESFDSSIYKHTEWSRGRTLMAAAACCRELNLQRTNVALLSKLLQASWNWLASGQLPLQRKASVNRSGFAG